MGPRSQERNLANRAENRLKSGKPASSPSICLSRVRFDMTNAVFAAIIAVNFARFTLKRISLVPLMF